MIINASSLGSLFTGFSTAYTSGFLALEPTWPKFAMKVTSATSEEDYGWMQSLPYMREWVGPRLVKKLAASGFTIRNRKFEQTISVDRTTIEDDRFGVFAPTFQELGRVAAEQPDKMVYELLASGFDTNGFDGQYFFDSDHPVEDANGNATTYSNTQSGSGAPWFLFDTSRAIKPIVYQERIPFSTLQRMDSDNDPNVFMNDEFIYGTRGRGNVGFGMWQLAFGSKATLNGTNYAAARASMMKVPGEAGRKLGIKPNVLLCGASNEQAALKLLNSQYSSGGETNEWYGTAELLVVPWLD